MAESSIVNIYDNMTDVENTIRALDEGGFPISQVSIIAQSLESEKDIHGYITTGDVAKEGVVTGAWVGGLFGLLAGAAFLWIPGFGTLVVAGPLAAALIGGLEGVVAGAAGGGLLGALFGLGISKEHILKYEEKLKGGKYLLVARGNAEQIAKARSIFDQQPASETSALPQSAV
jgi:hypothetical protein